MSARAGAIVARWPRAMCGRWLLLWRYDARWRMPDGALVLHRSFARLWPRRRALAETSRAGRSLATRSCFSRRAQEAQLVSPSCAAAGRPWLAVAACCPAVVERGCAQFVARPCARVRPCCSREFKMAAAGRPPLRRCSDDVVTAGLISSRVLFEPVPGSP
ncbi:F-box/LRR-repeat protein-like [Dorcoceras hygrometricum]|uniref:F-box/LRR-repeat protein-like n=1 Tax=Dorcoceras hygrometricum TaxID=472368 RepID=A0A2Z6ZUL8_9LAMI|nr:F-box/LRR-repeat protein-like [Dorcoceras hygrometricum]